MILFHAFKENIGDDVFHKFISYFALYHVFFFFENQYMYDKEARMVYARQQCPCFQLSYFPLK